MSRTVRDASFFVRPGNSFLPRKRGKTCFSEREIAEGGKKVGKCPEIGPCAQPMLPQGLDRPFLDGTYTHASNGLLFVLHYSPDSSERIEKEGNVKC